MIKALAITIKAKSGAEGKLFGSVTSMDITEAMKAQGVAIDKKKLFLTNRSNGWGIIPSP